MVRRSWIACLITIFCVSSQASAGWPFFADGGLKRGTPEYYEAHAGDPPGARQKYLYGKIWPVRARPAGPSQTFVHKYHTAHYWPHPYQFQDRAAVRQVFDTQVNNGWQTATTFYSYHFDTETNELNSAGLKHLAWLMTYAPQQYRQAYVSTGNDPQINSTRMLSVEKNIASSVGNQQPIPVIPRVTDPLGRPATEVQNILTKAEAGAPEPKISYTAVSGG